MLLCFVVAAWRKEMPIIAGLACGLMLYKPQLAAVVATMMVFTMGLRVLLGIGRRRIADADHARTHARFDWRLPHALPLNLSNNMQIDHSYLWERHVTLKAFWRLLFQGREAGDTSRWSMH